MNEFSGLSDDVCKSCSSRQSNRTWAHPVKSSFHPAVKLQLSQESVAVPGDTSGCLLPGLENISKMLRPFTLVTLTGSNILIYIYQRTTKPARRTFSISGWFGLICVGSAFSGRIGIILNTQSRNQPEVTSTLVQMEQPWYINVTAPLN